MDGQDGWEGSPFASVSHPVRRAWLEVYAVTGVKKQASLAVGISHFTPYGGPWKDDAEYQEMLPVAEEMAAAGLLDAARERAVDGLKSYKFTRDGDPLLHPTLCRCEHHDQDHVPIEGEDRSWGPCLRDGCGCEGYRRAPYYEHSYSDSLLTTLLKAYHDRFRDRLEVRGLMGKLDFAQLPPEAIERIAGGEHPLAVLAALAEGAKALPPGGEVSPEADAPPEL